VDENSAELAGLRWDSRVLKAGLATHFDVLTGVEEVVGACLERADSLPPSPVMRAACIDAFVSLHRFDFGAARRRQVWARPIYERTEGFHVGGLGMCVAAIAAMEELDGHGARRYLTVALGWSEHGLGRRSNMAQMVVTQLGVLEYRLGQAEAAERCLDEAYESGESGPTDLIFGVRILRPRLKAFHGDLAGAEQLLLEGAAMARERGVARLAAVVIEEQARLGLPSSGLEPAVPELTGGAQDGISIAIADSLAKARLHRILKHGTVALAQQALPDAGELLARTESQNRPLATVDARVLLAMMLLRAGKSAQAQESLITAVRACAGTGITSPITDGAGPVAELLTAILGRDRAGAGTDIVAGIPNDLLRLLRQGADAWIVTAVPGPLGPTGVRPETALLAREMEILRLLDTGCSNQQIAHALHLSTNTVKWYLKSLYAKLGVTRRLECVAAARSAGLL
jgi:ATP/maltotriose-dependent transcriptional regulator MalT